MSISTMRFSPGPIPVAIGVTAAIALAAFGGVAAASAADVGDDDLLGSAETFVIIASDTVTDAGLASVVQGDVALTATPAAMQLDDASQVINGEIYVDAPTPDPTAVQARADLGIAYGVVAGAEPTEVVGTANLALSVGHVVDGEVVYTPGVYNSGSSMLVDGVIVLDGLGNLDSVFVFQTGSELIIGSGTQIELRNGAQACNVYWQVGSSATIGTSAQFAGTVLAATSITAETGAVIDGQLLASALNAGAVTLDHNTINGQSLCVRSTTVGDTTTTETSVDGVTTTVVTTTPVVVVPPVDEEGPEVPPVTPIPPTVVTVVPTADRLAETGATLSPIVPLGGAALAALLLGGVLLLVRRAATQH